MGNEIKSRASAISKANKDIAEEKRRLEALHGGSHARRLAELDERKADAQMAKIDFHKHNNESGLLEQQQKTVKSKFEDHKRAKTAKAQQVEECVVRLQDLEQGQKRSGYPHKMDLLLKVIQSDEVYRERPVGPIGDYVRLTNPVWSSVLEKSFGNVLNGFIVTSKKDQERLSETMDKFSVSSSCPIYIGSTRTFDFTQNMPDEQYDTVLRVLKVSN